MQEQLSHNSALWGQVEASQVWLEIIAPWITEQIELATDELAMIDSGPNAADKRAVIQGLLMGFKAVLYAPRNQQADARFAAEMMNRQEEEDLTDGTRRRRGAFRRPGR